MTPVNRQFKLRTRPNGLVQRAHFELAQAPVPDPKAGAFLVRNLFISLDPAMRLWMNEGESYIPPVPLGEVMRAGAIGQVVESKNPSFGVGDFVAGMFGVQDYAESNGTGVTRVDPALAPLPVFLSALGTAGMTAYFGLLEIGRPKPGDTVVVSAAAGAVGHIVGQIAKVKGCRVIGIAGGSHKCAFIVNELGFDAAVDYKRDNVASVLKEHCPKGIDVYFDNVGGAILDTVLTQLAMHARIVICGAISQYNNTTAVNGPRNYLSLLVYRARMEGMLVYDWASRFADASLDIADWIKQGHLITREDIVQGFEMFPDALARLFEGENVGKLMLQITQVA